MVCLCGWGPWSLLGSSVTGHKLRLNVPDTAIIDNGLLKAWLYTDRKSGVVNSTPSSSLSCAALLHKLKGQHALYESNNPDGRVAVAYFSSHVTRLLDAQELEQLLSSVYVGALPQEAAATGPAYERGLELLAVQGYVIPHGDVRYVTTFGGVDGASTQTQCRRYSSRFSAGASQAAAAETAAATIHQAATAAATAVLNAQQQQQQQLQQPAAVDAAGGRVSCTSSSISLGQHDPWPMDPADYSLPATATHGLLSRSQPNNDAGCNSTELLLHAAPSLSPDTCATPTLPAGASWKNSAAGVNTDAAVLGFPRSGDAATDVIISGAGLSSQDGASAAGSECGAEGAGRLQSAPSAVSKAAAAAVQVFISYLDKAHGLRGTGLVSEFVLDAKQQLWLIGLHSIAVDSVQSKGSTTTFTERWGEFLAGAGPPPAPQLAQHTTYGVTADTSRSAGAMKGLGHSGSPKSSPGSACSIKQLNKQFFPLLAVDVADLPSCRPQSADPQMKVSACSRRSGSTPRCMRSTSPQQMRPSSSPNRQREGSSMTSSADCAAHSSGSLLNSSLRSSGPKGVSRTTASASRPGAGGNPTMRTTKCESYTLWLQQPSRPADSITAQLAGQLETAKEQVQQYADMAEAATLQADEATQQAAQQVASVQQELLQLRHDAAAASRERRQLQQQIADMDHQRNSMQQGMAQMHQQLTEVQEQLAQDRATMATMLREHQQQKQQYEAEIAALQQQNTDLHQSCQHLTTRLDEECEVVSALRAQLVDYKLQMEQMNLQAKKGRSLYSSNSMALRRGGSSTPPGQLQGTASMPGGTLPLGGLSSSGLAGGFGSDAGMTSSRLASSRPGTANAATASGRRLLMSASGTSSKHEQCMIHNRTALNSSPGSRRMTSEPFQLATAGYIAKSAVGSLAMSADRPTSTVDMNASRVDMQPLPTGAITIGMVGRQQQSLTDAGTLTTAGGSNYAAVAASAAQLQEQQPLATELQQCQTQPQQQAKANAIDTSDTDAAVSYITAAITADIGEELVVGARVRPQLFIADLLCNALGALEPMAEQQQAVLSGLLHECHGDLLEIFSYYATLGSVQVVADRMTMELPQFGKLAYDLHIPQDNKSLSAVEDAFYALSDRRPCLALKNKVRPPSAGTTRKSSRPGARGGSSPGSNLLGAAAAAAAASGTAYLGPGTQHAVARSAAWDNRGGMSGRDSEATTNAAAAAAAAVMEVLGQEVIVPEQFAEALIRLACVRYRWGVVNTEYDWDDSDDWEDEYEQLVPKIEDNDMPAGSLRMQRKQQQQQQEETRRHGPRVLKPEGQDLYTSHPPAVASSSTRRPASPCRSRPAEYTPPSAADDLVFVVKTFLQHEVLKHARRNKLAGSPLGHRRARSRSPAGAWRPAAT